MTSLASPIDENTGDCRTRDAHNRSDSVIAVRLISGPTGQAIGEVERKERVIERVS